MLVAALHDFVTLLTAGTEQAEAVVRS